MTKTILILGASYSGLNVAHSLLKKTLTTVKDYKVVLVSTTTHHYWNVASVRAIVPGQIPDDKIFQEIAPSFKKYPNGSFEFVLGSASSLDPTAKSVSITTSTGEIKKEYDILVITTGSRYVGAQPWKSLPGGFEVTMDSLHKIQEQVKAAKSIVIGGAGPTGVEAIAELGYEYGKTKKLTIITSGEELLVGSMPTNIAKVAENELTNLSVEIVKGTKITEAKPIANGKTELTLSNGEKILTDLYLPTVGIKYNSEFIPKTLLSATGEVEVDHFLKLKGAENIWAAGDITNLEASQFVYAERQATALAKILDAVLKGKEPVAYKVAASRMMGLSLGRSKATGRSGTSKIPSIIIWWFKGRTLGVENLPKYVSGSKF